MIPVLPFALDGIALLLVDGDFLEDAIVCSAGTPLFIFGFVGVIDQVPARLRPPPSFRSSFSEDSSEDWVFATSLPDGLSSTLIFSLELLRDNLSMGVAF